MYSRIKIKTPDDLFADMDKRNPRGVYFYCINGYNSQIHAVIKGYCAAALEKGIVIEGGLKNPDNGNIAYFNEQLGTEFRHDTGFFDMQLKKWLPRLRDDCRRTLSEALYDTLLDMRKSGKNGNILKNAYVKFMCWLYYRFERVVTAVDGVHPVRVLYEGECGMYRMMFLNLLSRAGCDILLLRYRGGDIDELIIGNMAPFPEGFGVKNIITEIREDTEVQRLYGSPPKTSACTNAWISGRIFEDVRKSVSERGNEPNVFYNCFCRINGVEDKSRYLNDLYRLQMELKNSCRNVVIQNGAIAAPGPDEINAVRRGNYRNVFQLISGLSANIPASYGRELQSLMIKAFADLMLEESRKPGISLSKLMNEGVYLLCRLNRYRQGLFGGGKENGVGCFLKMGGCVNSGEAMFCRLLARLPVDVLIFCPDRSKKCCLSDELLYEVNNALSMEVGEYPQDSGSLRVGTVAYHAERELDEIMYNGCGIYRERQYSKANAVTLRTMYEEIGQLWNQELQYRPGFSIVGGTVNMPVIFSKISGVKDGNVNAYWSSIKQLLGGDIRLVTSVPVITRETPNPVKAAAPEFLRNGKLQRNKIKTHKAYQYGYLREAVQEYILDKLQALLNSGIIEGVGKNGTEYTVIAAALCLDKQLLRMIQGFDFTKKNPKLVYLITDESSLSLEDSIQTALLNMIGFDIVFFVPTGYRCAENFFTKNVFEEHQLGQYVYDLRPPDFGRIQANPGQSLLDRVFKHRK